MPNKRTNLKSLSDLFASLDFTRSTNTELSSDLNSLSNPEPVQTRLKKPGPILFTKGLHSPVLNNLPDFSSYEKYELIVESEHEKENAPTSGPPSPQPVNKLETDIHVSKPISRITLNSRSVGLVEPLRSGDSSSSVDCCANTKSLFCSTPGPAPCAARQHKSVPAVRVNVFENLQTTPIPYPEVAQSFCERSKQLLSPGLNQTSLPVPKTMKKFKLPDHPARVHWDSLSGQTSKERAPSPPGDTHSFVYSEAGKKSDAFLKRLTRHLRVDRMILNRSYWELYESGDSKATLLKLCKQDGFKRFTQLLTSRQRLTLEKIGEGCFGEVFRCVRADASTNDAPLSLVLKLIPIEGKVLFNGEQQKTFGEVLSEVIVAKELTALSMGSHNQTEGFIQLKNASLVQGSIPLYMVKAWEKYARKRKSENDHPRIFPKDQLWLVLESTFGGCALEDVVPSCPAARLCILRQVAFSLAVAEAELNFEHRDLHWGNILVRQSAGARESDSSSDEQCLCSRTTAQLDDFTVFRLNGQSYRVPTFGHHCVIIDFTMSRLEQNGGLVYVNLASDPTLFESQGDYQFDIYRMMRSCNGNRWDTFCSKSNVLWLHYLAVKLCHGLSRDSPVDTLHTTASQQLVLLENDLRSPDYKSAEDLVTRHHLFSSCLQPHRL